MKKRISLLFCLFLLLNGCGKLVQPPSVRSVEDTFQKYREEVQIITDYLLPQKEHIAIYTSQDLKTAPEDVRSADEILRKQAGCNSIHHSGSTVYFILWTRFTDAGCGIAYTTEDSPESDLTYLTYLEPLSEPGWFYYVEDCAV